MFIHNGYFLSFHIPRLSILKFSVLNLSDHMSVYMTADINCNRKACYMSGISIHIDCEGCCRSSKSSRPDTKAVYLFKHFFFQIFYPANIRMTSNFPCQSLLCHQCAFFKSTANSHTYDHRRTGVGTCILHCC